MNLNVLDPFTQTTTTHTSQIHEEFDLFNARIELGEQSNINWEEQTLWKVPFGIKNDSIEYMYFPDSIRLIIFVSKNGEGKSIFLSKIQALDQKDCLLISPRRISKYETRKREPGRDDSYYYRPLPEEYRKILKNNQDLKDKIKTKFKEILENEWEILDFNDNETPQFKRKKGNREMEYAYDEVSDGIRHTYHVLLIFMQNEKSNIVYLVDEPESSLHPKLFYRLFSDVAKIAKRKQIFIIMATHSLDFSFWNSTLPHSLVRLESDINLVTPTQTNRAQSPNTAEDKLKINIHCALISKNPFKKGAIFDKISIPNELWLDMVGSPPVTIFCEGKIKGPDHLLLAALFDSTYVVIKPIGGCRSIFQKLNAIHQYKDVYSPTFTLPEYYGIIDGDRRLYSNWVAKIQNLLKWKIPEIETLLWTSEMIDVYKGWLEKNLGEEKLTKFGNKKKKFLEDADRQLDHERARLIEQYQKQFLEDYLHIMTEPGFQINEERKGVLMEFCEGKIPVGNDWDSLRKVLDVVQTKTFQSNDSYTELVTIVNCKGILGCAQPFYGFPANSSKDDLFRFISNIIMGKKGNECLSGISNKNYKIALEKNQLPFVNQRDGIIQAIKPYLPDFPDDLKKFLIKELQ